MNERRFSTIENLSQTSNTSLNTKSDDQKDLFFLSAQSSLNIYISICSILTKARAQRKVFRIVHGLAGTLILVQIFLLSFFSNCKEFWGSSSSNFHYFSRMADVIIAVLPYETSIETRYYVALAFFILFLLIIIFFIFTFLNLSSTIIYETSMFEKLLIVPFIYGRIISIPCCVNLIYAIFHFKEKYAVELIVFSAFNLIFCIIINIMDDLINQSFPIFSTLIENRWAMTSTVAYIFFLFVTSGLYSIQAHIPNNIAKTVLILLVGLIFLLMFITVIVILPSISEYYNIYLSFLGIFGFSNSVIIGFCFVFGQSAAHALMVSLFVFIPLYIICGVIVSKRRLYLTNYAQKCAETRDFAPLLDLNKKAMISSICLSFNGSFDALDWLINKYPDNFIYLSLYCKFALLYPNEYFRLADVLPKLRKICQRNTVNILNTIFIEMLYVQNCTIDYVDQINVNCCAVVDEYLMCLHLFWTEILLGRKERLISLCHAVYEKYANCITFFDQLGVVPFDSDHYQRFHQVAALKLAVFQKRPFNSQFVKTAFKESSNVFPFIAKHRYTGRSSHRTPGIESRSLSVEQVAIDIKKKLSIYQHLLLFIPFYTGIVVSVIVAEYSFNNSYGLNKFWYFQKMLLHLLYPLHTIQLVTPLIPLIETDFLSRQIVSNVIKNNYLFKTRLNNPREDCLHLIEGIEKDLKYFKEDSEIMKYFPEIQDRIFSKTFESYVYSSELDNTRSTNFFWLIGQILFFEKSRLSSCSTECYVDFLASNLSEMVSRNVKNVTKPIREFLSDFPKIVSQKVLDGYGHSTVISESIATILLALGFVGQMVIYAKIVKSYNDFFNILFALPKITISQLIDKLGSRISTKFLPKDNIEPDLKYNFTQLSYQEAPQSYSTTRKRFVIVAVVPFIYILLVRLLMIPMSLTKKNYIDASLENLKRSYPELIIPYFLQIIGQDVLRVMTLIQKPDQFFINASSSLIQDEGEFRMLLKRIFDISNYTYTNYLEYVTDVSLFPGVHNPGIFFGANACSDVITAPIACRSIAALTLYTFTSIFYTLDQIKKNVTIEKYRYIVVIESLISVISKLVPDVPNDLFSGVEDLHLSYTAVSVYLFYIFMFIFLAAFIITNSYIRFIINDPKFSVSCLSSLPPQVLASFSSYSRSSEKNTEITNNFEDISPYIFEQDNGFQFLSEIIILCDANNEIIAITPHGQSKLPVSPGSYQTLPQLIRMLGGNPDDLELPPEKIDFIYIFVQEPNTPSMFLKITFIPVKKFAFKSSFVIYAVKMEDITQRENLIYQLNHEANKVRMLMTQLVPWRIAQSILDDSEIQPLILPKLICISIIIRSDHIFNQDDFQMLQIVVRDLLQENPFLTYFGRSIQMFRVVSGIFDLQMPLTEQGVKTVDFAMKLIENMKFLSTKMHKPFDVLCGIHVSGPFYADIVEKSPPVYDIFGFTMSVSEIVAAKGYPNKVNITRDVLELIFQQGFDIVFENEIETINGSVQSIHMVQQHTDYTKYA